MRKALLFLFLFSPTVWAFDQKDLERLLSVDDLKALQNIIVSTSLSCAAQGGNAADLAQAKKELLDMAQGVAEVISESVLTLALKKDYPTACHVLSKELLGDIESSQRSSSTCLWKDPVRGGCILREHQKFPIYSYYWPKYFIEVSQKGNDPFPAFADGNKLYAANRKIANDIAGLADLKGPYELVAKVNGVAGAIKGATSALFGKGVDLTADSRDMASITKTAILTPFEKLRLRASQAPDQPSYEANVWPVGMSATVAKHLTVCGEGGFSWPIPGVPMTCPVAMARDAWAYWDSGMLDYLNPNTIRGITTATNPVSCIADNLASTAFDEYGAKVSSGSIGDKDSKEGRLTGLPSNLRGIGMCSFPILGKSEAIINQTVGLADSFKGPWCTLWGPIVPRMSTHVQNTDFAFANAALKFKLFAHDLFGIPRGAKERWSLAYPWEERPSEAFLSNHKALNEYLQKLGIKIPESLLKAPGRGRSLLLMPPGDPRMLDTFNTSQLATDAKNIAREVIYLASLNTAISTAEKKVLDAFIKEGKHERVNADSILQQHRLETNEAVDLTAKVKGEPVYEKKYYCHVKGERHGSFNRDEASFNIPGYGEAAFEQIGDPGQCFSPRGGRCIDRHRVTGKCIRPESVDYVLLEHWEIKHYRQVQNPRLFVVDPPTCTYSSARTPNIHHKRHSCKENLRVVGQEDTRERVTHPDPTDPEGTIGKDSEAGKAAAMATKIAGWVGAEIARAKYEEISGRSLLPGKKRVYTIFEKVTCEPKTLDGGPIYRKEVPGAGWVWNSCKEAVRLEVRKYFQTKLLRRVCDSILNEKLGAPFK